nr:integrase, catalytic region, zinc finger, CCHC-type, peptidase aspartic, catalytic [Tanacetum cinerariifolium]
MSTQQDIYAAGFENCPSMLSKDNYVPWSPRIIRYARSRPNGKMIVDSIENGPYVRQMIATTGEPDLPVPVPESFHEQTDEELIENDINQMDVDDQAIQTILLGLPEDVYADEKKANLFNEWEKFTSTDGESIKSYYHHFMQLMNDLKRNKHFPENIAANLKFLNNLQPEWKRHVTIVRQTKNLQEANFTQIYDFLKMNQDENGGIQVAQNAVQNAGVHSGGNQNGVVVVPGIANQNEICNIVAARAEGTGNGNQARCYSCKGLGHIAKNYTARPRRRDVAYLQTQLLIAQKEEAGIQLQAEEFDFMAAVGDLDEIEEVNANCFLVGQFCDADLEVAFRKSTYFVRDLQGNDLLIVLRSFNGAPLGYRAAGIRMRALLSSTSRETDIPEADMPPRKRACLTTPGFEIGESSVAGAARQPGPTESNLRRCRVVQEGYGITDTWDEIVDKMMEIAPTTLEGVNERVTEPDSTVRQRTNELEVRVMSLRDRPDHRRTAMLIDKEAMYSREAWAFSMDKSSAMAAHVRTLET